MTNNTNILPFDFSFFNYVVNSFTVKKIYGIPMLIFVIARKMLFSVIVLIKFETYARVLFVNVFTINLQNKFFVFEISELFDFRFPTSR